MEQQSEKSVFDFTRKIESVIEDTTIKTNTFAKSLKFASFLAIGGLSIGIGLGLTNGFMESHKIEKISEAKIAEMQAKAEQSHKEKKLAVDREIYAKEQALSLKAKQQETEAAEKIKIEKDRYAYDRFMQNKEDIISNYEGQLNIYDKAYQNIVKGVSVGVLGLDALVNVRGHYQEYRKDINNWINFVERTTTSFEKFRSLDEEDREFLRRAITDYQNGNLNRRTELEDLMMSVLGSTENDKKEKIKALRNELRNQMIDDLAAIMNNNTSLTTTKKLKK